MTLDAWSTGSPYDVYDLLKPGTVMAIRAAYGETGRRRILAEILRQALKLEARTAVVEYDYIDADYRSEYARFYASTFRRYPSVAHRLHFFSDQYDAARASLPRQFESMAYLGYVTLRPLRGAPVGRTMLRPPQTVAEDGVIACMATDRINLAGSRLSVSAIPFFAQDAQLGRCGQASLWTTAYYHHLAYNARRVLPAEISDAVAARGGEFGRAVPSQGLAIAQIADGAGAAGLPPVVYPLLRLAKGEEPEGVLCRYLNSRLPVIVAANGHAFVLVGYAAMMRSDGTREVHFLRQDDEAGPYQWIPNWRLDQYAPWQYAIVPLPSKVYMPGEDAEEAGRTKLNEALAGSPHTVDVELARRLADQGHPSLSYRSVCLPSNTFKASLLGRLPDEIVARYESTPMSRYVWVVELTDRELRDAGEPCVWAEVVIDATDHNRHPQPLAWRTPGRWCRYFPDTDKTVNRDDLHHLEPAVSTIDVYTPHL